ncbi:serine hydrolase domain-containing protein [Neolewinella persica]|uniref:serine hydrolase domain-containing protein n=1 Tax=Neolewinella persica TaxID=70998 RepID=UPI000380DD2B|nr:serine hydrolase domain-containing protein [Neolewinella persica]
MFPLLFQAQSRNRIVLDHLKSEMREHKIPGLQLTVIKENKQILSKALGKANVPFAVKADNNNIFSINSIAKVFASVAILQLVERGDLDLDKPIRNYLDDLPLNWQSVTLIQLLSHTSGLPDVEDPERDELVGGQGQDSAWILVRQMPLQFQAGESFSYNATNYGLLQKIIERYGEVSFEAFVREHQFKVAGMAYTSFGNSFEVAANKSPTYCYYYFDAAVGNYVEGKQLLEVSEKFPTSLRADAGAFSTAEDLAKWIIALQTGKLLKSKESIAQLWEPVPLNNGTYDGFGGLLNAYALGWPVIRREEHPGVAPIGGGRAAFIIYPEDKLAIVLLTNLSGASPEEIIEEIAKVYLAAH